MQGTWVRSLGREDPLEKRTATHSSILAWRILVCSPWICKELDLTRQLSLSLYRNIMKLSNMWKNVWCIISLQQQVFKDVRCYCDEWNLAFPSQVLLTCEISCMGAAKNCVQWGNLGVHILNPIIGSISSSSCPSPMPVTKLCKESKMSDSLSFWFILHFPEWCVGIPVTSSLSRFF